MDTRCRRCGSSLAADARVCPACGLAVRGAGPLGLPARLGPAAKWGLSILGLLALIGVMNFIGPHRLPPSAPPAPVVKPAPAIPVVNPADHKALAANILRVISLRAEFADINKRVQPDNAAWKAKMQQNAQDLKAATEAGAQYTWPDKYQAAQMPYLAALTDYGYVADHWPAAAAPSASDSGDAAPSDDPNSPNDNPTDDDTGDSAATKQKAGQNAMADCASHLKTGDVSLGQALNLLGLTGPHSLTVQNLRAKLSAPSSQ